jgi:hypothetical protein
MDLETFIVISQDSMDPETFIVISQDAMDPETFIDECFRVH